MVRFTQVQKDEFDKLYANKSKMTLLNALQEVQKSENDYPVLYLFLFGGDDNSDNQNIFAQAWGNPDLISVSILKYYLVIFPDMYVSLNPDGNVKFTDKWDFTVAYQKQFTQIEVDQLQTQDEFKNRINLDACKVEVDADDKAHPKSTTTTTTTAKPE